MRPPGRRCVEKVGRPGARLVPAAPVLDSSDHKGAACPAGKEVPVHRVRLLTLLALLGVLLSAAPAYALQDCDGLSSGDTSDDVTRVGNIFLGTSDDDTIVGTSESDVINAGDGDDLICGRDGDDIINAEGGDDRVFGGDGNDILNGGPGENFLRGGDGSDIVNGGGSDADCSGGSDPDIVNC
jgi:hypothetical protein